MQIEDASNSIHERIVLQSNSQATNLTLLIRWDKDTIRRLKIKEIFILLIHGSWHNAKEVYGLKPHATHY